MRACMLAILGRFRAFAIVLTLARLVLVMLLAKAHFKSLNAETLLIIAAVGARRLGL
jgi:hypothetical protein